jgi:hypothetical protein
MDDLGRLLLATLLLLAGATLYFSYRTRLGRQPLLRQIKAYDALRTMMAQAVETGRALHLSLGVGGIATETAADSLAGWEVLRYFSEQAAASGVPPIVSMADPTLMLLAQETLRRAHSSDPVGATEASRQVRWIAPGRAAYAAGVMGLLNSEKLQANAMIGNFGDEYLLMGETAARYASISHVGGASNPNVLPFIFVSADETLLGEEMYAAGAYLSHRPNHIGSLLAQDTVRWAIVLFILGSIVARSFGWIG